MSSSAKESATDRGSFRRWVGAGMHSEERSAPVSGLSARAPGLTSGLFLALCSPWKRALSETGPTFRKAESDFLSEELQSRGGPVEGAACPIGRRLAADASLGLRWRHSVCVANARPSVTDVLRRAEFEASHAKARDVSQPWRPG